jgi:hypothetical protein
MSNKAWEYELKKRDLKVKLEKQAKADLPFKPTFTARQSQIKVFNSGTKPGNLSPKRRSAGGIKHGTPTSPKRSKDAIKNLTRPKVEEEKLIKLLIEDRERDMEHCSFNPKISRKSAAIDKKMRKS